MPEKTIPDAHHVVRHCPKNRTIRVDGQVVGVIPRLFELRVAKNEKYLSACYFEYFDGTDAERISKCIDATPREVKDVDYMVLMNVGKTKEIAQRCRHKIRILHETAHRTNPAYARIKGVPFDPQSVALTMFATEAKDKMFAVRTHRGLEHSEVANEDEVTAEAPIGTPSDDTDAVAVVSADDDIGDQTHNENKTD